MSVPSGKNLWAILVAVAFSSAFIQLQLYRLMYYRSADGRKEYGGNESLINNLAKPVIPLNFTMDGRLVFSQSMPREQPREKPANYSAKSYPVFPRSQSFVHTNLSKGSNGTSEEKIILLWTAFFAKKDWGLGGNGSAPFRRLGCKVKNCFLTRNRSMLPDADVVLVHFRDDFNYKDRTSVKKYRKPNQRWTFVLWETPDHTYSWNWHSNRRMARVLKKFSNFFNWTMTYRLDFDVRFNYGRLIPLKNPKFNRLGFNRLEGKNKTAVSMASNCDTVSHRERFIKELEKHIDVGQIGRCRSNLGKPIKGLCARSTHFISGSKEECLDYLSKSYKFYLSFENSLCRDYVTEKFYVAAKMDLIPVVLNGADMSLFAPPNSYIDAQDFSSPESLAQFLKLVGSNEELYNSYFWWKPYYDVEHLSDQGSYVKHFCDLCEQANLASSMPASSYSDIDEWWTSEGNCYEGETQWT